MPRTARIDIPGILYHVMVRGIDRGAIFLDDKDRKFFLNRLAELLLETGTVMLAWSLLENHAHLLLRPRVEKLQVLMRRLLTSHAGRFNRRHGRIGHLFQNRYLSIPCQEDSYLLILVRYIHLNPLKAGLIASIAELDRYPWTGHPALIGQPPLAGHEVLEVLRLFGSDEARAREAYRSFIFRGLKNAPGPERDWSDLADPSDAQNFKATGILGNDDFVARLRKEDDLIAARFGQRPSIEKVIQNTVAASGLRPEDIAGSSIRSDQVVGIRTKIALEAVKRFAYPPAQVARALGVDRSTISRYLRPAR